MKLFRGGATIVEQEKPTLMHIATSSVNELVKMCWAVKFLSISRNDRMDILRVGKYDVFFS